jgi:hypothetical protein
VTVSFRLPDGDRSISEEEARWLLGQVRTARELTEAAASVATKLERTIDSGAPIETSVAEKRELVDAFERGAGRPRSHDLRGLEVALHAALVSAGADPG